MVVRSSLRSLRVTEAERRVGLVVRVSTDHQARNPEGSLTTQLQRLRQHLEYKRSSTGAAWSESALYELRGISGKTQCARPSSSSSLPIYAAAA